MDLPLAAAPQQPSAPATPPDPETGSLRSGCQQGWVPVRTLFLACRGAQSPFLGRETSQEWEASEQAVFCVAASFHFSPGRTLALSTSFCFPLVRPLRTAAVLSDSSCFGSNMPRRCETILLDFGVDPNIADVYGITALHLLSVMRVCQRLPLFIPVNQPVTSGCSSKETRGMCCQIPDDPQQGIPSSQYSRVTLLQGTVRLPISGT
ncbi:uncharacterized protein [Macaca nemestrina]|uniref:uncharacterized protein isoform X2 n=1 Tax=Macaca nemestrina TaxID=9545 RepID=UPI0039B959C2